MQFLLVAIGAAVGCACTCAEVSAAQSPIPRSDEAPADSARVRLPPVKITATRQSESIYATPLAVSVVGPVQLQDKRGIGLDEAFSGIPGVLAQSRYGGSDVRLTIRGFGARGAGDRSNAGTSRGIRILLDGIPETEPDGRTSFDLIDLHAANRIEIVRSNASALWGNAAGGVVSISTVQEFDAPFAKLQQMTGSFGLLRTVAQGGTKFGASSLAFTFTNSSQRGWRQHSDSRRFLVNSSLDAALGDDTDVRVFLTAANSLFHIPGPLTRAEAIANPRAANATYASRDERRYNKVARIGVTLDHALSGSRSISAMVFTNPKILQRSERNTFRDFDRHHAGGNLVFQTKFNVATGIRGSVLAGGDRASQDGEIIFHALTPSGGRGAQIRDHKREGASNTGIFVQQGLVFNDRLNLDLGVRYDNVRYDYRNLLDPATDAGKSFARVTPKLGLSYRFSPANSIYLNLGGGVEAPAGNETDPASTFGQDTVTAINPLLEPIRSTTFEIGARRLMMRSESQLVRSVSYDAALYVTDVANEIVPYRGGRFYFSAGQVQRRGAEFGTTITGSGAAEFRGAATFSRNRYVRYTIDSVHYGRPGAFASYAGNHVAGVPGFHFSASVAKGIGPGLPARVELALRGVGKYFLDDANAVEVPGYQTVSATLASTGPLSIGRIGIRGFLTLENIANRAFIGSAFVNPDIVNGEAVAFEPGTPRSLIVSLSLATLRP